MFVGIAWINGFSGSEEHVFQRKLASLLTCFDTGIEAEDSYQPDKARVYEAFHVESEYLLDDSVIWNRDSLKL